VRQQQRRTERSGASGIVGANFNGDFVSEFTSAMLTKSGSPAPAGVNLSSNFDAPEGEAFDSSNNLWVSNFDGDTLTMFTFAQLKAFGTTNSPQATVVISGLNLPNGLAFDGAGDLWWRMDAAMNSWSSRPLNWRAAAARLRVQL
jgi:DNA-binding beta-propeller fold protein YncE